MHLYKDMSRVRDRNRLTSMICRENFNLNPRYVEHYDRENDIFFKVFLFTIFGLHCDTTSAFDRKMILK